MPAGTTVLQRPFENVFDVRGNEAERGELGVRVQERGVGHLALVPKDNHVSDLVVRSRGGETRPVRLQHFQDFLVAQLDEGDVVTRVLDNDLVTTQRRLSIAVAIRILDGSPGTSSTSSGYLLDTASVRQSLYPSGMRNSSAADSFSFPGQNGQLGS